MVPFSETDIEIRRGRLLGAVFLILTAFAVLAVVLSFLGPENLEPLRGLPWTVRIGVLALVVGFVGLVWERERELSRLSKTLLREAHTRYAETLAVLAGALDAKDHSTQQHTGRMGDLAEALAKRMGLGAELVAAVRAGAILHDIGKIGIPDAVLTKAGPLTDEETAIMQTHPVVGENMLKRIDFLAPVLPYIRHHHESWDGTGYPDGLSGTRIPMGARIIAVCDAFDAMTSDRPYRAALTPQVACQRIFEGRGTQFDPDCVQALVDIVSAQAEEPAVAQLRTASSARMSRTPA